MQVMSTIGALFFSLFVIGYLSVQALNRAGLEDILIEKLFKRTTEQKKKRREATLVQKKKNKDGSDIMPVGVMEIRDNFTIDLEKHKLGTIRRCWNTYICKKKANKYEDEYKNEAE